MATSASVIEKILRGRRLSEEGERPANKRDHDLGDVNTLADGDLRHAMSMPSSGTHILILGGSLGRSVG
jgi:hypothetical protein